MPKWHFTNKSDFSFSLHPVLCLKMLCWGHPRKMTPCPGDRMRPEWTPALGLRAYAPLSVLSPLLSPSHRKPKKYFSMLLPRAVVAGGAGPESPAAEALGAPTTPPSIRTDLAFQPQPHTPQKAPSGLRKKRLSSPSPWGGAPFEAWGLTLPASKGQ